MKRIKFVYDAGYVGTEKEEIFEFDDDANTTEIQNEFEDWLIEVQTHSSWAIEVDEDNNEIGDTLDI